MKKFLITNFKQISIKDGQLKASFEQADSSRDDSHLITYQNTSGVHEDLTAAMQGLAYHVKNLLFLPQLFSMTIIGFYKQNSGNAQLLTIYARLGNDDAGSAGQASLAVRHYLGRDEYAETDQLIQVLGICEREALAYMERGKTFTNNQVRIDEEDMLLLGGNIGIC